MPRQRTRRRSRRAPRFRTPCRQAGPPPFRPADHQVAAKVGREDHFRREEFAIVQDHQAQAALDADDGDR